MFAGLYNSYGQDKSLDIAKPSSKKTSSNGTINIGSMNNLSNSSTKTIIRTKTNSSKTSKTAGDTEAPTIICPPNQQLACGSLVPNYFPLLSVSDNMDTSIDVTQFPGQGSDFYNGMVIKFTATDDAGNRSECSITLTASSPDVTPPTFTCPTGLTLNCGDVIPNYALSPIMNLDDDCSINLSYMMTPGAGTPFYDGIPIQIEYFDQPGNKGNRSVCNFIVRMATPDVTSPVITSCVGTQNLPCGSVLPDYRTLIAASDNCLENMTVSQIPGPGSSFIPGMTVTMTVRDAANNPANCSFIVNASPDTTKPTISCPGNQSLSCGSVLPDYSSLVTATDNCTASPTITQTPVAGSAFTSGMTVTMRAVDASGNFQTCSFIVNASPDTTKPTISCPGNQSLSCGSVLPDYSSLVTAADNCTASPTITQTPVAGSAFTSGMTVTMRAVDASGNFQTCSFIVNASADTTKPTISCPGNQSLSCGSVLPDYSSLVTATDNCTASPTITQTPVAGSAFTSGMTVTMRAVDASGNFQTCSFIVNASPDTTKPTISCPGNQSLSCGSVLPDYSSLVTATDNCTASPTITQTPVAGSAFTSGMTVTMRAVDASGNFQTCSFIVNASPDATKPTISCPGNQSLSCGSVLPDYSILVTAADNCTASPTITQTPVAGSAFTSGMTVTMRAVDASGNFQTCSFIVNASPDTTKPTISCPGNQSLALGSALPDYTSLVTVTDDCTVSPIITQTPVAGSVFNSGMIVTIRATDASGNFSTCSFAVNGTGSDLPPTITCPSNMELYANSTLPDYVSFLPTVTDDFTDSFDLIFTQTPPQGTLFTADTNVTITVKDASGNMTSCSFLVKLKTATTSIDCKTTFFSVSNLNGTNGFTIYGEKLTREAGFSVNNAGDVNGDGITDLIIGAPGNYNPWYGIKKEYKIIKGAAYVVFGKSSGFTPNIDLGLLNGSNGFVIRNDNPSSNFPMTGYAVSSAGDINGDGVGDFMISDPYRQSSFGNMGHTYVVFGKNTGFSAEFNLSTLNGNNGFTLIGINNEDPGVSITSVGDINGDGYTDIAAITSGSGALNGKCYIVYGKNGGFPAILRTNQLNGTNGFTIDGDTVIGKVGTLVAGLGDINGDGISDMALGSYNGSDQYRKYIVFGRSSNFPVNFNISALNGTNGFIIENSETPLSGYSGVSKVGDINDDGLNDVAINGDYILFGKSVFPAIVDIRNLDGSNGFKIKNANIGDKFGYAGDFNADGIDDYFFQYYNSVTILFGKKTWTAVADIFTEKKLGIQTSFSLGYSANFGGDVNNDGITDLIIGNSFDSYGDNLKVNYNPGMTYVIYGKKTADTEKPIITNCPPDKILTIHDPIPDYTKDITVTDNCDTKPVIIQTPVAGTLFTGVSQNVVLTVTDASGNKATCTFIINSSGADLPPSITCPSGQELFANSILPNYVHFLEDVSDDIAKPFELIFTQTPAAGTLFTSDTNVTITVEDKSGNKSSCSFLVKLKTGGFDINCNTKTIDTNELNSKNGFTIYGETAGTRAGFSTSPVGDINGDGMSDFVIGAPGDYQSEGCYVVFGTNTGFPASINLADLNGLNGFHVKNDDVAGPARAGFDVSDAGDINGDGVSDFMLTAPYKSNGSIYGSGEMYVIYGQKTGFSPSLLLSSLNGANGFTILGQNRDEFLGIGIAGIGDFNNDSHSDIAIVSANQGSGNIKKCYVLFGRSTNFPSVVNIESLDPSNSFIIEGDIGNNLSGVGDVNGDGISDVAISGEDMFRYVVYGSASLPSKLNTSALNGSNGFRIENSASPLKTSYYFEIRSAGDLNGDSYNDIGINNFILFGKSTTAAVVDLKNLDGTNGFKMNGSEFEYLHTYSSFGDFNKDGFDDYLLPYNFSQVFVIYGKANWSPLLDIFSMDSSQGLVIKTPYSSKYSLSFLGDINGDSIDDIIIGKTKKVYTNDPNEDPGISYVVFGKKIEDKEKPTIKNCPINQVLAMNDPIPDYTKAVTIEDNCDDKPAIEQVPVAGTLFDGITKEVVLTVKDASGNVETCKFNISTTADTEAPVLTCPSNQQLTCGSLLPDYLSLIIAADNTDPAPTITQNPLPGSAFNNGMTVTITAKDASNNESTCSFKVNVAADVVEPIITCIGNQTLATGSSLPDYSGLITVTDNCDASPIITQVPLAGSAFVNGMTVTITAKDASGNIETCSFTVNESADTESPVLTCLADQNVVCTTNSVPDYTKLVTVTDNSDSNPVIIQNPLPGSAFINGMTVKITAKDASNNESSCSFKVDVAADVVKPVITCIGSQSLSCSSILPDYTKMITATDNCDTSPVITQNPLPGDVFTDGMTVIITAKDASNNESTCSFKVNLSADVTKPLITCIGNQALAANAMLPDYTDKIIVSDNCDSNLTVIQTPAAGVVITNGMTVQMKVSDNSGNESNCSFVVNTIPDSDTQAPVITCLSNQKITCNATKVPDFTTKVLVVDNKDPKPVVRQSPAAGSVFTYGMTITITATDVSSNKSECSFKLNSDIVLVDAGNDIEINQGEVVQLEAVATEEGTFKWSPIKGVSNASVFNPFFSPDITTTYKVSFTNKEGCEVHDFVVISVKTKVKDETKYGFSPNNDGINDYWEIDKITDYPKNEVSIYNSWGDLVFQTTGYNNTTNVFNGIANKKRKLGADELPEGTYFFEINPNSATHHFKKLKGYLVLKR